MSGPTLDARAASEREFRQRLAELRREESERFSPKARAWLVLPPAWTDELARACSFPFDGLTPEDFVREAAKADLCVFQRTPSGYGESGVLRFWVPDEARAWLLRDLYTRRMLQHEAQDLGQLIQKAATGGVRVSPLTHFWAKLAALRTGDAATYLINTITELVGRAETGDAQTWVAAAKHLAQTFGGPLESAVRVGENLIEREYRRVQDERYLERFLPITEQLEAFERLMQSVSADGDPSPDAPWALHYVGHGGVGKTMLLRHITSRLLAEDKGHPKPFSRIDFDYLSPDYPMRRPGQLLQELAAGLRAEINSPEQSSAYATFQSIALELHEALSEEPTPEEPLANIRRPEFEQTLKAFNDFLLTLPQPVVLFLDTCEELAKVQTAGGRMPTVEATFEILERIHAKAPRVRVVFAGRRLLAKAGHDWSVSPGEIADARRFLPEHKNYLLLHDIRGFNKYEAEKYLSENEGLTLEEDLLRAVLDKSIDKVDKSPDKARAPRVNHQPPRPDALEDSYNPFYLSLYAHWIKEDPKVEAGDISGGKVDPYVEIRIVNRVAERVREVLPAAVLLRRFNKEMLAEALTSPERLDEVYQQLSGQEWINYQWDEELQTNFLEVDRNLHGRLLEYYENSKDSHLLDRVKKDIAPGLARLVRGRPTRQLTVEHLDAVLRMLPAKEAAEVWGDYELRVAKDGTWGRALRVTERVLSVEGAVKSISHPLRAALRATRASATLHVMPEVSLEQLWLEVEEAATAHPDAEVGRWLGRRALAGRIASLSPGTLFAALPRTSDSFTEPEHPSQSPLFAPTEIAGHLLKRLLVEGGKVVEEMRAGVTEGAARKRMEQLFASFCAVHEACAEAFDEFRDSRRHYDYSDVLNESARLYLKRLEVILDAFPFEGQGSELAAFCAGLQGRGEAIGQNWDGAATRLDAAVAMVAGSDEGEQNRQRWLDWRAPASLRDRLRLERLRCIPPGRATRPPWETILRWQGEAAGRLGDIDSERLVSFIIQMRLSEGLVPEQELEELQAREKYDPNRQPWRAAHRVAPPLLCSLALGWLARGDGARGLALATNRIEGATGTREDQPTVRAAEAVKLHIIRRMRLPRRGTDVINRLARSKDQRDVLAIRELIAVNGTFNPDALLQPTESAPASVIHAWWRSQTTLTREAAGYAVERLNKFAARRLREAAESRTLLYSPDAGLLNLVQDWGEATRVARNFKISGLLQSLELTTAAADWGDRYPTRTEDALRLDLRDYAKQVYKDPLDRLVEKVGKRRCAEVALEEGELLALRLPGEAVSLLSVAVSLFEECGDYGGAVIAMTLIRIAQLHGGVEAATGDMSLKVLHEVHGLYDKLAASDTTLPGWYELEALRFKPSAESLARLNHPSWQGWLHRLVYLSVMTFDRRDLMEHGERWRKLLKGVYGRRLPVELTLSPAELERLETAAPSSPLFLRILFRYWVKAAIFPALIFFSLLLGGVINMDGFVNPFAGNLALVDVATYLGVALTILISYVGWMKKGLTNFQAVAYLGMATVTFAAAITLVFLFLKLPGFGASDYLILLPVILGGALIAWAVNRRMRAVFEALRVTVSDASLQILPDEHEGELKLEMFDSRSVRMIFRRRYSKGKWLLTGGRVEDVYEGTGWIAGLAPYREAMKMMPLEVSNELFRLNGLFGKIGYFSVARLRVALVVDPSLAHYPWEAALSQAAAGSDEFQSRIHFWRAGEPLAEKSSTKYEKKIYVVVGRMWETLAVRGWSRLWGMKINTGTSPKLGPQETLRLLHVIGTPTRVSAGLRLQVSEPATSGAAGRGAHVTQAGGTAAAAAEEAVRYFGTEDLPLEQSALVVVQAEPSEFSVRQQTQREQTARLRAYAADIFAAGARCVLLLPSLPDVVAEEVLKQLGKDLRAGDQPILLFLQTIERIRGVILKGFEARLAAGDLAAAARLELALDICVFTRDVSPLSHTSEDKTR